MGEHADLESQRSIDQHEETVQLRISELIPAGSPFNFMAKLVCHPAVLEILHHYLGHKCRCATFSSNTLLPQGLQALAVPYMLPSGAAQIKQMSCCLWLA